MMRTGTMDMIAEAMPTFPDCTARRLRETPRKGPKKAPAVRLAAAFPSLSPDTDPPPELPETVMTAAKPRIPADHAHLGSREGVHRSDARLGPAPELAQHEAARLAERGPRRPRTRPLARRGRPPGRRSGIGRPLVAD